MRKTIITCMAAVFLATGIASAQQGQRFEAELEMDRVSPGNPVYLYLTFYGGQDVDAPEISPVDGLQIKYVGPATRISVVNGKVSRSVTHTYLLLPLKEKDFVIGPFSVDYGGRTFEAGAVKLYSSGVPVPSARRPSVSAPMAPALPDQAAKKLYVGDKVFLTMDAEKRQVYMNEVVPLTIKLYVYRTGLKDIEYPMFPHEGFSTGKMLEPERRREVRDGKFYDVLIFRQDLFGIKEGKYTLGPVHVNAKVVMPEQASRRPSIFRRGIFDDDFFDTYATYPVELESGSIPMTVLPFPAKGRPSDFKGAVGNFDLDVVVDPKEAKVGDPITVRMVIRGTGNLDTVTAPEIRSTGDFKTYEPQVTKKGDKKIYEQVLIPRTEDVKEIPEISFSFFHPEQDRYLTLKKGPFPIKIVEQPESEKAVKLVSIPGAAELVYPEEKLGRDIVHIKDNIGRIHRRGQYLYGNPLFWIIQVVPIGLFSVFFTVHRRRERLRTDKRYARLFHAPRKAKNGIARAKAYLDKGETEKFYDTVFRTLQDYLGGKFNLPKGSITSQIIEEKLRPAGYDESMLEELHEIFLKCEMARYASSMPAGTEGEEVLEKVKNVIDHIESSKK